MSRFCSVEIKVLLIQYPENAVAKSCKNHDVDPVLTFADPDFGVVNVLQPHDRQMFDNRYLFRTGQTTLKVVDVLRR